MFCRARCRNRQPLSGSVCGTTDSSSRHSDPLSTCRNTYRLASLSVTYSKCLYTASVEQCVMQCDIAHMPGRRGESKNNIAAGACFSWSGREVWLAVLPDVAGQGLLVILTSGEMNSCDTSYWGTGTTPQVTCSSPSDQILLSYYVDMDVSGWTRLWAT